MSINKIEIFTYVFIASLIAPGMFWAFDDPSCFNHYIKEDGLIEWLTVVGLCGGMVLCFFRAAKLYPRKSLLFICITLFFAIGFLFAAGEEISWGQRIFGINTPDWFAQHNRQRETNLHNLIVLGQDLNKLVFSRIITILFLIYFFVLTPLYRHYERFAQFINALALPIPKYHHIFAFAVLAAVIHFPDTTLRVSELFEFGSVFIIGLIFFFPFNQEIFFLKQEHEIRARI